jgi:hypothetical protein
VSVERLEIFVEEPSMEAALRSMLPRWLGAIDFEIYTHEGKDDLLAKLPARLRAYSHFLPDTWRVIVLIDRDDSDCRLLKRQLESYALAAGLVTRSSSTNGKYNVANRIAIEELEAWYFGDWQAVTTAYPKIDTNWPDKAGYRNSDGILGGTWEAFERVAQKAGYFKGGLRKVDAASRLGALLNAKDNVSPSFQAFYQVIEELVSEI